MFTDALLLEDDPQVSTLIQKGLHRARIQVRSARTLDEAFILLNGWAPQIFLVDLVLPDGNGLTFVDAVRERHPSRPVVIITGLSAPDEVVQGLDRGADLYLTKPFTLTELLAHLRALHRRLAVTPPALLEYEGVRLDQVTRTVTYRGASVDLTDVERALFGAILSRNGEVASREELFSEVWHLTFDPETGLLHSHIRNLRSKLSEIALDSAVVSVRGKGYRIRIPKPPPPPFGR